MPVRKKLSVFGKNRRNGRILRTAIFSWKGGITDSSWITYLDSNLIIWVSGKFPKWTEMLHGNWWWCCSEVSSSGALGDSSSLPITFWSNKTPTGKCNFNGSPVDLSENHMSSFSKSEVARRNLLKCLRTYKNHTTMLQLFSRRIAWT